MPVESDLRGCFGHASGHVFGHVFRHVLGHVLGHVFGHAFGHVFGPVFGHVFGPAFGHVFGHMCLGWSGNAGRAGSPGVLIRGFFGEALCVWLCLSGLVWECRLSWISGGAR